MMSIEKDFPNHRLLHQMSDLIEEFGVVMVDYTSSTLVIDEEYISPYSVVALCHRGDAKSEYDMKPVEFHAHDISVMRPGHVVKNTATSADYSAQLIVTSASCLNRMRQQYLRLCLSCCCRRNSASLASVRHLPSRART